MDDAIATVISSNNNYTQRQISRLCDVPRSTLGHRIRGRPDRHRAQQGRMLLTLEEEDSLVRIIMRMCEWHWAPPKAQIRSMAADLLLARLDDNEASIGHSWVDRFLGRHLELKKTWSTALESTRAAASAKPENITKFLDDMNALIVREGIEPENVWNFDEKGVRSGDQDRLLVVGRRGCISFDRQRRTAGNREPLTLIECCSAAGRALPPLVILKAARGTIDWARARGVPDGKDLLFIDSS